MAGEINHLGTVTKPIPKIKTASGIARTTFAPEHDMFIGGWTQPTGTGQAGNITWPSGTTLTCSNASNATYTLASDALNY